MATLVDIWLEQKDFYLSKTIDQIISIAGDGILRDGNETSAQLREFLANIPPSNLEKYIDECLAGSFNNSGLVLQDLINEVGSRLGFQVKPGYYRGGASRIGFDGIWRTKNGYSFVVEVKTTDAYQINLDTLAKYRNSLIEDDEISKDNSSILLVVGRKDTGGLEAQTRGSRHAWDIRIISAEALLKLMQVKVNLTDHSTVSQIQGILKPLEYTRVDKLIDIIFKTSEDLQIDDVEEESEEILHGQKQEQVPPSNYHEECVKVISAHLEIPLIRQGRATYTNADQKIKVLCIVSKEYQRANSIRFWYAFHPSQKEFLEDGGLSYVALGCGSPNEIVLLPSKEFIRHLPIMRTTEKNIRYYWHVEIFKQSGKFLLYRPTNEGIDVTKYLISN